MKTTQDIAQALAERRGHLKLTQKDIKGLIGMSQQQYSKAESTGEISIKTLLKILEALDLEMTFTPKENLQKEAAISDLIKQTALSDQNIQDTLKRITAQVNSTSSLTESLKHAMQKLDTEKFNPLHNSIADSPFKFSSAIGKKLESLKDDD